MFKINKKRTALIITLIAIIGSMCAFFATNLILSSISHKDLPMSKFLITFFPSLTFLIVAMDMVLFIFFFVRLYLHPTHEKKMLFIYGIVLSSFSATAIILNTLSGVILYGSFLEPRPFAGFHIIMYIYHIIMLGLGFAMIFFFRKRVINDDIIIHKTNVVYVLKTILFSLIIFIALNRFGAFLLSPAYIQWSSLTLTYPAYIALILPAVILVNILIYLFNGYRKYPSAGIVISSFVVVFSAFFFTQIIIRGQSDPLFIQLISPVNPIGRLLTFPYDTVLQLIVAAGLGIYALINSINFKRECDFDRLPYELRMAKIEGRKANFIKPAEDPNAKTSTSKKIINTFKRITKRSTKKANEGSIKKAKNKQVKKGKKK